LRDPPDGGGRRLRGLAGLLIEQGQLKANCNQQNQSKKTKKKKGKMDKNGKQK